MFAACGLWQFAHFRSVLQRAVLHPALRDLALDARVAPGAELRQLGHQHGRLRRVMRVVAVRARLLGGEVLVLARHDVPDVVVALEAQLVDARVADGPGARRIGVLVADAALAALVRRVGVGRLVLRQRSDRTSPRGRRLAHGGLRRSGARRTGEHQDRDDTDSRHARDPADHSGSAPGRRGRAPVVGPAPAGSFALVGLETLIQHNGRERRCGSRRSGPKTCQLAVLRHAAPSGDSARNPSSARGEREDRAAGAAVARGQNRRRVDRDPAEARRKLARAASMLVAPVVAAAVVGGAGFLTWRQFGCGRPPPHPRGALLGAGAGERGRADGALAGAARGPPPPLRHRPHGVGAASPPMDGLGRGAPDRSRPPSRSARSSGAPRRSWISAACTCVDANGEVFKRAVPGDGLDLPVVTGIGREAWVERRAARWSRC